MESIPRHILKTLPRSLAVEIAAVPATHITTGMSGAEVFRLRTKPARFLKFACAEAAEDLRQEIVRTAWLADNGIGVAHILRTHDDGETAAMLTEALPGTSADRSDRPKLWLLSAIGHAVARIHALSVRTCSFDECLDVRLERARLAIGRGAIDASHFALRNANRTPDEILQRLASNRPVEDLVVAHGDLTLSNIVIGTGGTIGFVDCGHAGRADRYLDLAILGAEIVDHFGNDGQAAFLQAYGMQNWDEGKALYYSDLYELF